MKKFSKEDKKYHQRVTKYNMIGLGIYAIILLIGFFGAAYNYKPTENIYTFSTILLMVIVLLCGVSNAKFRPIKWFPAIIGMHTIFCVGASWWWLSMYWVIHLIAWLMCIKNYIDDIEQNGPKATAES